MHDATVVGAITTAIVTIIIAAFALVKQAMTIKSPAPSPVVTTDCMLRIMNFIEHTEKALVESNRIQHTQARSLDAARQEMSNLRTEISEIKGMINHGNR